MELIDFQNVNIVLGMVLMAEELVQKMVFSIKTGIG